MSEESYQPQPIAMWNNVRGVWETSQASLLCAHLELYSETWPLSGTMRDGRVYALPMPVRHITGSESSLLRSPKASEGEGGALGEAEALRRGNTVGVRDQVMDLVASQGLPVSRIADNDLLPTPNTMEHREIKTPEQIEELKQRSPGGYRNLREEIIHKLPTPKALDGVKGNLKSSDERIASGHQVDLPNVAIDLLATPQVDDSKNTDHNQDRRPTLASQVWETERTVAWGKFEPAIRRWEEVLGRLAPAPTKPDGKDGAHRLSSEFTEWMMGLEPGWVTDCGLTRNEELKACGNGVVPQQAELALRMLLNGVFDTNDGQTVTLE